MSSVFEDLAAENQTSSTQPTSSFKVNQLKDQIVAKAQGLPEYTNLPPQARGILNEALAGSATKLGSNFVNDLDVTAAGVLNKVPLDVIGINNPMDLINGNLDPNGLKNLLNADLDIGSLAGKFKGVLTNEVINEFNNKLPPILRGRIDINQLANALTGGISAGVDLGLDKNLGQFSVNTLAGKIPDLPTVPRLGNLPSGFPSLPAFDLAALKSKVDALKDRPSLASIGKDFDSSIKNAAFARSQKFDFKNIENKVKARTKTEGFIDPTATLPNKEYQGRSETNKLATNDVADTIVQIKDSERYIGNKLPDGDFFDQPEIPYNAEYPYNRVIQSESGHIIEIDDTPESERIHIYHKNGTFIELDQSGSVVSKTKGSQYRFVDKNDHLSVGGQARISISGEMKVYCASNVTMEVDGDVNLKCFNDITAQAAGKIDLAAREEINLHSANINIEAEDYINQKAGGNIYIGAVNSINNDCTNGNIFVSAKDSITNKCNSSMFLHTLKDMHINADENFNLLASNDMSVIATNNLMSSATIINNSSTDMFNDAITIKNEATNINSNAKTVMNLYVQSGSLNAKASSIQLNNPSPVIPTGFVSPQINIASVGRYANVVNKANIGLLSDRKSVIVSEIFNPVYTNYKDKIGYDTEDSEEDKDSETFLNKNKLAGLSDGSEDEEPTAFESESPSSNNNDIISPNEDLKLETYLPDNIKISDQYTLGQLSSRAIVTKNKLKSQVNLKYGEIAFNLSAVALNVCDIVLELFPNAMVTSAFRHPSNNNFTSDHLKGKAVDFQFRNVDKKDYFDIAIKLSENLNYDKLLLEYKDTGTKLPWIHVSFDIEKQRKILLTYNNHKRFSDGLSKLA